MIGGEKKLDLVTEAGARHGIVQETGDAGNEVRAVKILDDGKDFHVGAFGLQKRHHLVIHGTNGLPVDYVEHVVGLGIDALQVTIGTENLQPCRKEQIDLAGILSK